MKDIKQTRRNKTYYDIVEDILDNEEYLKLKNITHHGMNRYEHNKRVSFYSYKTCKMLHLDYESAARGGALHDFFLDVNKETKVTKRIKVLECHPTYALNNAENLFDINEKEKDIILTHMFPVVPKRVPKYLESWIVDMVDNWVGIGEKIYSTRKQVVKYTNNYLYLYKN